LPVGKGAFFTNAFTNVAGKNMRNPEKISSKQVEAQAKQKV